VRSLYWALATMSSMGYGLSPVAVTDAEFLWAMICQVTGACMYAAIFGNIAQLIAKLAGAASRYQAQLDKVNEFIRFHHLPNTLRDKLHAYNDFLFAVNQGFDVNQIAHALPPTLQREVYLHLYEHLVRRVPMFTHGDNGFIEELVQLLKPQVVLSGDCIFRANEAGTNMYFIQNGVVHILDQSGTVIYSTLIEGAYFGELSMLTAQRRTATARAVTDCILFYVTISDFEGVVKGYPKLASEILDKAIKRLEVTLVSNASNSGKSTAGSDQFLQEITHRKETFMRASFAQFSKDEHQRNSIVSALRTGSANYLLRDGPLNQSLSGSSASLSSDMTRSGASSPDITCPLSSYSRATSVSSASDRSGKRLSFASDTSGCGLGGMGSKTSLAKGEALTRRGSPEGIDGRGGVELPRMALVSEVEEDSSSAEGEEDSSSERSSVVMAKLRMTHPVTGRGIGGSSGGDTGGASWSDDAPPCKASPCIAPTAKWCPGQIDGDGMSAVAEEETDGGSAGRDTVDCNRQSLDEAPDDLESHRAIDMESHNEGVLAAACATERAAEKGAKTGAKTGAAGPSASLARTGTGALPPPPPPQVRGARSSLQCISLSARSSAPPSRLNTRRRSAPEPRIVSHMMNATAHAHATREAARCEAQEVELRAQLGKDLILELRQEEKRDWIEQATLDAQKRHEIAVEVGSERVSYSEIARRRCSLTPSLARRRGESNTAVGAIHAASACRIQDHQSELPPSVLTLLEKMSSQMAALHTSVEAIEQKQAETNAIVSGLTPHPAVQS